MGPGIFNGVYSWTPYLRAVKRNVCSFYRPQNRVSARRRSFPPSDCSEFGFIVKYGQMAYIIQVSSNFSAETNPMAKHIGF